MELYGVQDKSIPQKIIINLLEIFIIWFSYWLLFQEGGSWLQSNFNIHNATGSHNRRSIIFIFNIIIFLRIGYMMLFLLKRKIPFEECISIPIAFALYYVGFSLFVLPVSHPIDWIDFIGIGIFFTGCILNTGSEVLRNQWKKNIHNKGKLYTGGFFRYSRHINYFGDVLWVSSYALLTRNIYAAIIPVFLFCFFAFYNAPKLDVYLRKKYGSSYDDYAGKTKMLVPFIY